MEKILDMQQREKTGKGPARRMRRKGLIPAVLYGYKGNRNLTINAHQFSRLFEEIGEHSIITITIDGKDKTEVIVKDFQMDPVERTITHVDFLEFEKGKMLKTEIPIKVTGSSVGVKKGGILEAFIRDIEVECLPKDIPDSISLDVSDMDIGNSLHVRDIEVSDKVRILSNPDQVVITIGTPTKVEEPVLEEEIPVEGEEPEEGEKPEAETEADAKTESDSE